MADLTGPRTVGVAGRRPGRSSVRSRLQAARLTGGRSADMTAVVLIGAWTWLLEGRKFWNHDWVSLGWGDWAAHAYRAAFLDHWGLTNWDPDWNNGLPLFQGYQTLPHVLTVSVSHALGTGIPHAMMMWTAVLLMLLPVSGYLSLRGLGVGPAGALLGSALLLDNADIGPPIEDFSFLFGLALMPVMVWIALKLIGRRGGYVGALAIGLTPYLHPYATTAAVVTIVARLLYDRRSLLTRHVALQGGVVVLVSSFYWLPFITSARPKYEDPWNSSLEFEHEMMARAGFHGLSTAVLVLGGLAVAGLALKGFRHRRLVIVCGVAALLLGAIAGGSYEGLFPAAVVQIHFARLMPVVGVLIAMTAAPVGDEVWARASRMRPGVVARTLGVVVMLVLVGSALVEGRYWFHDAAVPIADTSIGGRDLVQWASEHRDVARPMVTWTNTDDVAYSSYAAFGQYHFTGDYIVTRQWTVASPLLNDVMQAARTDSPALTGDFSEPELLLKLYGVQYVFLSDYLPANQAYVNGPLRGRLKLVEKLPDGWMATVPWTPVGAFVASLDDARSTTLPDLSFRTSAEQSLRMTMLARYVDVAYSSAATPASITWKSPTQLDVSAVARPGSVLVVPQNWDTVWSATADGRALPVERIGPNFVGIRLGTLSGPITVSLEHGVYRSWQISAVLIVVGVLVAIVATLRWDRGRGRR